MHGGIIILGKWVVRRCLVKRISIIFKKYKIRIKGYSHICIDYNKINSNLLYKMNILNIYQNLNKNSQYYTL